ncbi:hypothetical protein NEOKW01_1333 [Nematocida sp. AWRm80]|nr:hypothetical protein NEOKW01_1333 [Nematocida sp. AWRm80]
MRIGIIRELIVVIVIIGIIRAIEYYPIRDNTNDSASFKRQILLGLMLIGMGMVFSAVFYIVFLPSGKYRISDVEELDR